MLIASAATARLSTRRGYREGVSSIEPTPRLAPDPAAVLEAQALRLRLRWSEPGQRARARARLGTPPVTDRVGCAWLAVLDERHPFAVWLDSERPWSACPLEFDGLSRRQMVSAHPFVAASPWLIRSTSPAS